MNDKTNVGVIISCSKCIGADHDTMLTRDPPFIHGRFCHAGGLASTEEITFEELCQGFSIIQVGDKDQDTILWCQHGFIILDDGLDTNCNVGVGLGWWFHNILELWSV